MWSLVSSILSRILDRPRLTVEASFTETTDVPPYRFRLGEVLLISTRNPTKEPLPIDTIEISVLSERWILNEQLESTLVSPPCTVPARGRAVFWIRSVTVAQTLLAEGLSGTHTFDVEIRLSAGQSFRSPPVAIDLDERASEQKQTLATRERALAETARSDGGQQEAEPISREALSSYLRTHLPNLPLARNEHQLVTVLNQLDELDCLSYARMSDVDVALSRTGFCRDAFRKLYPSKSAMDEVVRAFVFDTPDYYPFGFPLRPTEFKDQIDTIRSECLA